MTNEGNKYIPLFVQGKGHTHVWKKICSYFGHGAVPEIIDGLLFHPQWHASHSFSMFYIPWITCWHQTLYLSTLNKNWDTDKFSKQCLHSRNYWAIPHPHVIKHFPDHAIAIYKGLQNYTYANTITRFELISSHLIPYCAVPPNQNLRIMNYKSNCICFR